MDNKKPLFLLLISFSGATNPCPAQSPFQFGSLRKRNNNQTKTKIWPEENKKNKRWSTNGDRTWIFTFRGFKLFCPFKSTSH